MVFKYFFEWVVGWLEKWGLKLTSAKVEVEVEAELGNKIGIWPKKYCLSMNI